MTTEQIKTLVYRLVHAAADDERWDRIEPLMIVARRRGVKW